MKKISTLALLCLFTTLSHAGCLSSVKKMIEKTNATEKRSIALVIDKSVILKNGEDSLAYGGEYYNNLNQDVEVFFLSESNGYYKNFSALLVDPASCKVLAKQALGDDA